MPSRVPLCFWVHTWILAVWGSDRLLSSSLPENQNIWIFSVYHCFHWRKRPYFRNRLSTLFWFWWSYYGLHNSCIRIQERDGKWSLLKEQHKVLCIFGSPSLPCGSTQFLGLPSTTCFWHLPRLLVRRLMTARIFIWTQGGGHSHCVTTNTIIWKKKVTTNEYFFLYYFDSL